MDYDKAAKFAMENKCNYIEVSAYSGHNVKSAFKMMVDEVYKKQRSYKLNKDDLDKDDMKDKRSVLKHPDELKTN